MPRAWIPPRGGLEKKVVFSPCCGDETTTYYDRTFFYWGHWRAGTAKVGVRFLLQWRRAQLSSTCGRSQDGISEAPYETVPRMSRYTVFARYLA